MKIQLPASQELIQTYLSHPTNPNSDGLNNNRAIHNYIHPRTLSKDEENEPDMAINDTQTTASSASSTSSQNLCLEENCDTPSTAASQSNIPMYPSEDVITNYVRNQEKIHQLKQSLHKINSEKFSNTTPTEEAYLHDDTIYENDTALNIHNFWEAYSESEPDEEEDLAKDLFSISYGDVECGFQTRCSDEVGNTESEHIEGKFANDFSGVRKVIPNEKSSTPSQKVFKKVSFRRMKHKFQDNYEQPFVYSYSAALDILASYVKCHIDIYLEASYYCSRWLNMLMMPCIFISAACSVLSASLESHWSNAPLLVAGMNGMIAFLLAIINYLKLDACSEAHNISSYQYSKLKSYIEFTSGEFLLFQDPILSNKEHIPNEIRTWKIQNTTLKRDNPREYEEKLQKAFTDLLKKQKELEEKMITKIQGKIIEFKKSLKNIHENNKFILPKHIAKKYSEVYNVNIFTYIKSIENYKLYVLNELRNIKNELRFNLHRHSYPLSTNRTETIPHYVSEPAQEGCAQIEKKRKCNIENLDTMHSRIHLLYLRKNELFREYFELHNGYALIDCMFRQQVENIHIQSRYWYLFYLQRLCNFFSLLFRIGYTPQRKNDIAPNTSYPSFYSKGQIFIPETFKNPRQFGYVDRNGVYLLEKIMHHMKS